MCIGGIRDGKGKGREANSGGPGAFNPESPVISSLSLSLSLSPAAEQDRSVWDARETVFSYTECSHMFGHDLEVPTTSLRLNIFDFRTVRQVGSNCLSFDHCFDLLEVQCLMNEQRLC